VRDGVGTAAHVFPEKMYADEVVAAGAGKKKSTFQTIGYKRLPSGGLDLAVILIHTKEEVEKVPCFKIVYRVLPGGPEGCSDASRGVEPKRGLKAGVNSGGGMPQQDQLKSEVLSRASTVRERNHKSFKRRYVCINSATAFLNLLRGRMEF